jgi:hypothetical protein
LERPSSTVRFLHPGSSSSAVDRLDARSFAEAGLFHFGYRIGYILQRHGFAR